MLGLYAYFVFGTSRWKYSGGASEITDKDYEETAFFANFLVILKPPYTPLGFHTPSPLLICVWGSWGQEVPKGHITMRHYCKLKQAECFHATHLAIHKNFKSFLGIERTFSDEKLIMKSDPLQNGCKKVRLVTEISCRNSSAVQKFCDVPHFWPRTTGQWACAVEKSGVPSEKVLNQNTAEPLLGTAVANVVGNAVYPPSSTSFSWNKAKICHSYRLTVWESIKCTYYLNHKTCNPIPFANSITFRQRLLIIRTWKILSTH